LIQSRLNHLGDCLRAVGKHQRHLRHGRKSSLPGIQNQRPDAVARPGPARLPRQDWLVRWEAVLEPGSQPAALGRFARSIQAFQGDKQTAWHGLSLSPGIGSNSATIAASVRRNWHARKKSGPHSPDGQERMLVSSEGVANFSCYETGLGLKSDPRWNSSLEITYSRRHIHMMGSLILEVAIGMMFIYLLLSLVASALQEILSSFLQARAANLQRGLRSLFSNDKFNSETTLLSLIYDHGLVRGLYQDPDKDFLAIGRASKLRHKIWTSYASFRGALRHVFGVAPPGIPFKANDILLPAYIPSRTFALALIDILNNPKPNGWDSLKNIEENLSDVRQQFAANKAVEALLALVKDASQKPEKLQANLENWYNDSMDRVSGWYKRYVQKILIIIGFGLAVGFNVDSIHVAQVLWTNKDAREATLTAAGDYLKEHPAPPVRSQGSDQKGSDQSGTASGSSVGPSIAPPAAAGVATASSSRPAKQGAATVALASGSGSGAQKNTVAIPAVATKDIPSAQDRPQNTDKEKPLDANELQQRLKTTVDAFKKVNQDGMLPIGWGNSPQASFLSFYHSNHKDWWKLLRLLVGWMITAIALSLGAPFWFDTLNKFMVVRGTVKPQEKSQSEKSKDA
jgi:hypothetical protein